MRSGALIWLPETSQAALHRIAVEIYVARIGRGGPAKTARTCLDWFMKRRQPARDRLGTDDPAKLAEKLRDAPPKERAALAETLPGVRLFPLDRRIIREADLEFNQFPQILAYWRSAAGPYPKRELGPLPWLAFGGHIAETLPESP